MPRFGSLAFMDSLICGLIPFLSPLSPQAALRGDSGWSAAWEGKQKIAVADAHKPDLARD
jgi:hypothetical protein